MEMKPTAPYTPPPTYSSTMPYPETQPPSYGYPHPATSGTPNHSVAPPTTVNCSGDVHTVISNHKPSSIVVTHKYQHPYPKLQFWLSVGCGLLFAIVAIAMLVKIMGISSEVGTLRTPQTHTFFSKRDFPSW